MDAVISTKGQIVIPKRLRDQWGLITGSRVKIASTPAGIQISPVAARTALKAFTQGVDFADALHAAASKGATRFVNFDGKLVKRSARGPAQPPVVLAA